MGGGHSVDRQLTQSPIGGTENGVQGHLPRGSRECGRQHQQRSAQAQAAPSASSPEPHLADPGSGETAPPVAGPFPSPAPLPSPARTMRKPLPRARRPLTAVGQSCLRQRSQPDRPGGSTWHSGQHIQRRGPAPPAPGRAPAPDAGAAGAVAGAATGRAPGPGPAAASRSLSGTPAEAAPDGAASVFGPLT